MQRILGTFDAFNTTVGLLHITAGIPVTRCLAQPLPADAPRLRAPRAATAWRYRRFQVGLDNNTHGGPLRFSALLWNIAAGGVRTTLLHRRLRLTQATRVTLLVLLPFIACNGIFGSIAGRAADGGGGALLTLSNTIPPHHLFGRNHAGTRLPLGTTHSTSARLPHSSLRSQQRGGLASASRFRAFRLDANGSYLYIRSRGNIARVDVTIPSGIDAPQLPLSLHWTALNHVTATGSAQTVAGITPNAYAIIPRPHMPGGYHLLVISGLPRT